MAENKTNEGLLQLHALLSQEIIESSRRVANIFIANVTLMGALLAYGLANSEFKYIFLAPFVTIFVSLLYTEAQLKTTKVIAAYLRQRVEPGLGLSWQGDYEDFRKNHEDGFPHVMSIAVLYLSLAALCVLFSLFPFIKEGAETTPDFRSTLIMGFVAVMTGTVRVVLANSLSFCWNSRSWSPSHDAAIQAPTAASAERSGTPGSTT